MGGKKLEASTDKTLIFCCKYQKNGRQKNGSVAGGVVGGVGVF